MRLKNDQDTKTRYILEGYGRDCGVERGLSRKESQQGREQQRNTRKYARLVTLERRKDKIIMLLE